MNRLNADGHDESQYLPRGIPRVNPYRAKHGKLEWRGDTVHAVQWMPDVLQLLKNEYGHELLSIDQVTTAMRFYSALVSTRKELGIGDVRGYLADRKSELTKQPVDIFWNVVRGLLPYQCAMLLWVVCDEYNHGNVELAVKLHASIQQALDNTQKIIDEIPRVDIMTSVPAPELRPKNA